MAREPNSGTIIKVAIWRMKLYPSGYTAQKMASFGGHYHQALWQVLCERNLFRTIENG